jgi:heme-degrading monooxygenase HmoA
LATYNTLQFYLYRADQARGEAEVATLSHVRDRCRRSEAAWTQLAERSAATENMRQKQLQMKAAEAAKE